MPTGARRSLVAAAIALVLVAGVAVALTHPWARPGGTAVAAEPTITPTVDPASLLPDEFGTQCAALLARRPKPPPTPVEDFMGMPILAQWANGIENCMANRIEGKDAEGGVWVLPSAAPGLENYLESALDAGEQQTLTVYWHGDVPTVVKERLGAIPEGFSVNFVTTGISKALLEKAQRIEEVPGSGKGPLPAGLGVTINQPGDWSGLHAQYFLSSEGCPSSGESPDIGVSDAQVVAALQPLFPGVVITADYGAKCLPAL